MFINCYLSTFFLLKFLLNHEQLPPIISICEFLSYQCVCNLISSFQMETPSGFCIAHFWPLPLLVVSFKWEIKADFQSAFWHLSAAPWHSSTLPHCDIFPLSSRCNVTHTAKHTTLAAQCCRQLRFI